MGSESFQIRNDWFWIFCGIQLDFTSVKAEGNHVTLVPLGSVALGRIFVLSLLGAGRGRIKSTAQ